MPVILPAALGKAAQASREFSAMPIASRGQTHYNDGRG